MAGLKQIPWWRHLPFPWRTLIVALEVGDADEIPQQLPSCCAVLVGNRQSQKWIAFDCPCKQHHRVMLNLDHRRRPHWQIGPDRALTLKPSVDDHSNGTRCHYFVRNGRIQWVGYNETSGGGQ